MHRYTLSIQWRPNEKPYKMVVISDESKENTTRMIQNYQHVYDIELDSPVELMDAVCDTYGWQWEDFEYDIEIQF